MKIAACIILYHPQQSVEKNILSYINEIEKLYVIDNTKTQSYNSNFLKEYQSKTIFIHTGMNEGIARRLNQACNLAINEEFDFLLTMDQDSFFNKLSIDQYFFCVNTFSEKENISMFGINHEINTNSETCTHQLVKLLITSGSIINLKNYKNVDGFDENLFIDFVDTEYCFKSILKGFKLIKFPGIYMNHALGTITTQRSLKNLQTTSRSIHSSTRLYYMVRNFLYVNKKYKNDFGKELSILRTDLFHRIKNKMLYNPKRLETIKLIFKARKDFRTKKMGNQV